MARWTYVLLDMGTLLAATGMGVWWHQPWLARWRSTLLALALTALLFILWDIAATARAHWAFDTRHTLGPGLFGLPFEEYLFFPVVSLAALAVWQRLAAGGGRARQSISRAWLLAPAGCALAAGIAAEGRSYTALVACAAAVAVLMVWRLAHLLLCRAWLYYQVLLLALFGVFNTLLTALPVVTYGAGHSIGFRIGTIPIEDFLYNFALVNLIVVIYTTITVRNTVR